MQGRRGLRASRPTEYDRADGCPIDLDNQRPSSVRGGCAIADADAATVVQHGDAGVEIDRGQIEQVDPTTLAGGIQGRGTIVGHVSEGAGGESEQLRLGDLRLDSDHLEGEPAEGRIVVEDDQVDLGQSLEDIGLTDHDPARAQRAASRKVSRGKAIPGPVA